MSQKEHLPLSVRMIRYMGRVQVFAAFLAVLLAVYLASLGPSDFLRGVLNGLGYDARAHFGFEAAGRVSGRALITLLLYAPLLRFVQRRNLPGVRVMAGLSLLRGLAMGEWILAAAVLILSFWRSTARYFNSATPRSNTQIRNSPFVRRTKSESNTSMNTPTPVHGSAGADNPSA